MVASSNCGSKCNACPWRNQCSSPSKTGGIGVAVGSMSLRDAIRLAVELLRGRQTPEQLYARIGPPIVLIEQIAGHILTALRETELPMKIGDPGAAGQTIMAMATKEVKAGQPVVYVEPAAAAAARSAGESAVISQAKAPAAGLVASSGHAEALGLKDLTRRAADTRRQARLMVRWSLVGVAVSLVGLACWVAILVMRLCRGGARQ
jgi:hypothetical protein